MHLDPSWVDKLVAAAVVVAGCLAAMAIGLCWWRRRLTPAEDARIRARIAAAAPEILPQDRAVAAPRHIPARGRSDLGQRTVLASSFVGRDRTAIRLE